MEETAVLCIGHVKGSSCIHGLGGLLLYDLLPASLITWCLHFTKRRGLLLDKTEWNVSMLEGIMEGLICSYYRIAYIEKKTAWGKRERSLVTNFHRQHLSKVSAVVAMICSVQSLPQLSFHSPFGGWGYMTSLMLAPTPQINLVTFLPILKKSPAL